MESAKPSPGQELPPLVRAMLDPGFYPHGPAGVRLVQTHISWVFLAGDLVYKVKKPVMLPFLDFSTTALRKAFCEQELRLNRRLAPETYLAVRPLFADGSGGFTLAPTGEPADYAVVMKRLPESGMFSSMLAQGRLTRSHMELVAARLSSFHAMADTGGAVDLAGRIGFVGRNHTENFTATSDFVGGPVGPAQHEFLRGFGDRFLRENYELFASRVKNHRIRDCHGDLHLDNICLDGESLVIFDCIEFSRHFRYEDVAAEVAFLAMDLEFHGAADLSRAFTESYVAMAADAEVRLLLRFYKFYRACVRAKVFCIRSRDRGIGPEDRRASEDLARRYFDLAALYAARPERPCLFAVMGLSGSGKSVLSRELAALTGASQLQSDVIRKELFGVPVFEHQDLPFAQGMYGPEASARTFDEIHARAEKLLRRESHVLLDATFLMESHREAVAAIAERTGAAFYGLWCSAPEEVVRQRMKEREQRTDEASDARFDTYLGQKGVVEPPRLVDSRRIFHIETLGEPRELAFRALSLFFGGKGPEAGGPQADC